MNPLLLGSIFTMGQSLIDKLFPDPVDKLKAQTELAQMQQSGELQALTVQMSAIIAEAQSPDPWTSRARPMFMYVFYSIILFMTMIGPMLGIFFPDKMGLFFMNVTKGFAAIPEDLWWTFSAGYLGYAGLRTVEKNRGKA
jgi:hypothetical protein